MNAEQLKTATEQAEIARRRREVQHAFMLGLDEHLAGALERIERSLPGGQDVHKWLAEELTDDPEHPVTYNQVHDWLSRRNGRRPPSELIFIVYDHDEQFRSWWNRTAQCTIPEKLRCLTDAVERDLAFAALKQFGEEGERKIQKIRELSPERVEPVWQQRARAEGWLPAGEVPRR